MNERTESLSALWTFIDGVLNSVLFSIIALEGIVLNFAAGTFVLAEAAISIVIFARLVAVSVPMAAFK